MKSGFYSRLMHVCMPSKKRRIFFSFLAHEDGTHKPREDVILTSNLVLLLQYLMQCFSLNNSQIYFSQKQIQLSLLYSYFCVAGGVYQVSLILVQIHTYIRHTYKRAREKEVVVKIKQRNTCFGVVIAENKGALVSSFVLHFASTLSHIYHQ